MKILPNTRKKEINKERKIFPFFLDHVEEMIFGLLFFKFYLRHKRIYARSIKIYHVLCIKSLNTVKNIVFMSAVQQSEMDEERSTCLETTEAGC